MSKSKNKKKSAIQMNKKIKVYINRNEEMNEINYLTYIVKID